MEVTRVSNVLCLVQSGNGWAAQRRSIDVQDGMIASLPAANAALPAVAGEIDGSGWLAVPGLVNCHTHSPDNLVRGTAGDLPLELWSLASSAGREQRTPREIYISVLLGAIEMMRSGTTSVVDHVRISPDIDSEALDAVAQAWRDSGMRATIAPVVSDKAIAETMPFHPDDLGATDLSEYGNRAPLPARTQMDVVEAFHGRWDGAADGRIRIAIGPSGPQRCTDGLLVAAADFAARKKTLLHTHVLETRIQREMGFQLYGRGMVAHLEMLGILGPRTNLVHSIWLEDGDIEIIARSGASIIHNPVSNARLGSGYCALPALIEAGVSVGLGTDSACCNDGNNLLETAKWAALLHNLQSGDDAKWIGPARALTLATSGGAEAIDLAQVAGRIEPGFAADLTFFRLASPAFVPLNDPVRQLVLSENGSSIAMVLCAGRILYRNGKAQHLEETALWEEAEELAAGRRNVSAAAMRSTGALEAPIRRMQSRLIGSCSCH